ncbi:hypothetical protein [Streptomyces sp. NRRL S-337]|uniref:hypothetical protein n=1 Tax=Streptomyces sp. NRRL S-337 TaxID=1463900 RepID=UPI000A480758|nr:hypothetical protein [Streptomyces sp. NRRL S-337]
MPIRPENRRRYPADWPEISLSIRTGRAGGQCECLGECGRGTHHGRCPNRNARPAYGTGSTVVLTVAHLDHTPEHCDPANLRAMCQGCHLHYDQDHHRQTAAATRRAALEQAGQQPLFVEPVPAVCEPEWQPRRRRPVVDVPGPDHWPAAAAALLTPLATKETDGA